MVNCRSTLFMKALFTNFIDELREILRKKSLDKVPEQCILEIALEFWKMLNKLWKKRTIVLAMQTM